MSKNPRESVKSVSSLVYELGWLVAHRPRMTLIRQICTDYFLINARNLDEAIVICGQIPGSRIGTVEIRPVM